MLLVIVVLLSGCATAYVRGRNALAEGRYDEAASHFQESLARTPERLEALAGLGISRYKLGALDEAADALGRALAQAPGHPAARLYSALIALQRDDRKAAIEHLEVYRGVAPDASAAAQIDRALAMLRRGPLPDEVRQFVAASLESDADRAREVRELRLALQDYVMRAYWYAPYWYDPVTMGPWGRPSRWYWY
jgi:tetratricopeptide (TPR) repeat protein